MGDSEPAHLILYGTDMPDGACVNSWPNWPHDIPQPGDKIRLADGDWEVQYRVFNPSAESVMVYAEPPEGARGKS